MTTKLKKPAATGARRKGTPSATRAPAREHLKWLIPSVVVLTTSVFFLPVLDNEFLDWDDAANIIDNPYYRGLGWSQIHWMFTTFYMSLYRPLTWVTLGLDYSLWGLNPFGYHLTSLIFHAINALLFYFISLRLLRFAQTGSLVDEIPLRLAAATATLFFSLHPLRVEPVAWVSARNDLVAALFVLLTVWAYLRAVGTGNSHATNWRWLFTAWTLYALSLLAKASGMALPLVLLALDIYPLKRLRLIGAAWFGPQARSVLYEKLPFIVLAILSAVPALIGKKEAALLFPNSNIVTQFMQSMYGCAFYLRKTLLPIGLSPLYELPAQLDPLSWPFLLSALLVVAISLVLVIFWRRCPALLAAWVCYLALLAPFSGAIRVGPALVTDRYSYLACMGWAVLMGAVWLILWRASVANPLRRPFFWFGQGVFAAALIALGAQSWQQSQTWHDSARLWQHALTIDPNSGLAHHYLGAVELKRGSLNDAIAHFAQAVQRIDPIYSAHAEAYYNYGLALAQSGQIEPAIRQFRRSLELQPNQSVTHFNLANALAQQGKLDEAAKHFEEAVRIHPGFAKAYHNLGRIVAAQGRLDTAIGYFRQALDIDPNFAAAHESLARALTEQGKKDEAAVHFREALRILNSSQAQIAK